MQTREQKIVGAIGAELKRLGAHQSIQWWTDLRSTAQSMPSLMLKHGPAQLIVFYMSKAKPPPDKANETVLLMIYQKVLVALSPGNKLATVNIGPTELFEAVAARSLTMRLHDHALSNEIATWIARSIDAEWRYRVLIGSVTAGGAGTPLAAGGDE